jgi:hypothetical protein
MKIYFQQIDPGVWRAARNLYNNAPTGQSYFVSIISDDNINKIVALVKEKFKSVKILDTGGSEMGIDAVFSDEADEAAFILWSSDGIEI